MKEKGKVILIERQSGPQKTSMKNVTIDTDNV